MIRSSLSLILRNMVKNKYYFVNSIFGLAIGMAAALLIFLYIKHESSYEAIHKKSDRIVRINTHAREDLNERITSKIPFPVKGILHQSFPEVEKVARLFHSDYMKSPIRYKDSNYLEDIYFADPEVFDVFDFELLRGDRNNVLANPNSIILTEHTALKYFGDEDPLGKVIRFEDNTDLTVTGILKDPPSNSHLQFNVILPVEFQRIRWKIAANNFYDFEYDWLWHGSWTYVLLQNGADQEAFAEKIKSLPDKYYTPDGNNKYEYLIQPLAGIHLTEGIDNQPSPAGSMNQIYGLAAIAVLILFIACINFTNLATAQAPGRSKEVGLRKVMGANRPQLVVQFLTESTLIVCISIAVGLLLAQGCLPVFNELMGKNLTLTMLLENHSPWLIVAGTLSLGILAGLYPAILLSRFNPAKTLKGIVAHERNSVFSLRSALVIFQLTISFILVSGILIIHDQMSFIRDKDLGFEKEQILTIKNGQNFRKFDAFKEALSQTPAVREVYRGYLPGARGWTVPISVSGMPDLLTFPIRYVGENFISMFDLNMVAGRNFTTLQVSDTLGEAMVNERALQQLGLTADEALGREVTYVGGNDNKTVITLRIVGVVEDVNFESLYNPIQPTIFQLQPWGDIAIRISSANLSKDIKSIEKVYNTISPEWPFEYSFLDSDIDAQYKKEEKLANAIQFFSVLAVLLSSAGLIALSSFTAQQRAKEIAVRKVHGAPLQNIVLLLTGYFAKLGLIGLMIASPVSLYLASRWLQSFAFHVDVNPMLFISTALVTIIFICLAVLYQILRVSNQNPIITLNNE